MKGHSLSCMYQWTPDSWLCISLNAVDESRNEDGLNKDRVASTDPLRDWNVTTQNASKLPEVLL